LTALVFSVLTFQAPADQVDTQNGERYVGKVISINAETLVLQSEVLGTVRLPRSKVAHITLGTNLPASSVTSGATTNAHLDQVPSLAATNSNADLSVALRQLGSQSNLIEQVEAQFLSGAGPEAKEKFNELMGGLLGGRLNVNDIRAEAKSAADQMRAAKKELGEENGFMIDSYLAILDSFLKETAPAASSTTNVPALAPKAKAVPKDE
jgi:hypothetical protein